MKSYHPTFNSNPRKYKQFITPMLARLGGDPFDDPDWVYEIKWDGYRAIAEVDGEKSRLYSRNGLSFSDEYPTVFADILAINKKMIIDGEIVALDEKGRPSFQLLQQYGQNDHVPLVYYVFDILYLDGKSVENKSLLERKELLKTLLPESETIKYCEHIAETGDDFFNAVKENGLEGMIAKRAASPYKEGARNGDWLKIKHVLTDEAIICGYTAPRNSRKFFGALILGSYENGELTYIGHTGTGFNDKALKEMHQLLQPLVTKKSPFKDVVKVNSPVTWVKPELVCNIKYTEKTAEGSRRHPVYLGLREDKAAKDVHAEERVEVTDEEPVKQRSVMKTKAPSKVELTNTDKVYWPDEGYTKGDMLDYYNTVYPYIIPYLKGRPQSLNRTPNGIKGKTFYHKDAGGNAPDWMQTHPVYSDSAEKIIDYLVINDKPSLLYVANMGCIEINPWNSTVKKPEHPDYLVLDLDPSVKNTFDEVVDCALVIKEILDRAGIDAYCKTSGSTGLHIYLPMGAKYDYDQARQFAELLASMAQEQLPGTTTLERSLSKRKKNHIYIDYLQNRRGQTLSSVYSLRPKPGAPVSTPLEWKEVKHGLNPVDFNIKNTMKRLEKKGDLFSPVLKRGLDMAKALKNLQQ